MAGSQVLKSGFPPDPTFLLLHLSRKLSTRIALVQRDYSLDRTAFSKTIARTKLVHRSLLLDASGEHSHSHPSQEFVV